MGKLYLICGDYIENSFGMDAIVNAANKYMISGSGICGVIYRNAGAGELEQYCKENMQTEMVTGETRITPGFNLNMDIIHTLAPKYYEEEKPIEKMIETYRNMLNQIEKKKYKNVLMCSIGTGIHGYKHEDVAMKVISLLERFCELNDVNIYFNNINPTVKDIYLKEFIKLNVLDLKKDLYNLSENEIIEYLKNNGLIEKNIKFMYKNFCSGKDLDEMCISEKLICLQYCIEVIKATKDQIMPLLESL